MVVYIDELFILNLIINYLLLLTSAMLCGSQIKRLRIFAGAAAGALYACFMFFPDATYFYTVLAKTAFSALMSVISYGFHDWRTFLRRTLIFYVVSFAFAGAMMALFKFTNPENAAVRNGVLYAGISSTVLIAVALGAYLIMTLLLKNAARGSLEHAVLRTVVAITLFGKTIELEAMVDTGNRLTDPLTNGRIVVVEYTRVRDAFPHGMRAIFDVFGVSDAAETLRMLAGAGYGDGFRLIPYRAIGTKHGFAAAPAGRQRPGKRQRIGRRACCAYGNRTIGRNRMRRSNWRMKRRSLA